MLEDLDFADDLTPLSSTMNNLQHKTTKLIDNVAKWDKLNGKKCKEMKAKRKNVDKLLVGESKAGEVESFISILVFMPWQPGHSWCQEQDSFSQHTDEVVLQHLEGQQYQ